jgi:hypothetical protein
MIDMTKQYRTRNGRKARVLTVNAKCKKGESVVALVTYPEGHEVLYSFNAEGQFVAHEHELDLIEYNPAMDLVLDQAIWVSEDCEDWYPRHFAKFEDGEVFCWHKGATSHTCLTGSDSWSNWSATKPEDTKC